MKGTMEDWKRQAAELRTDRLALKLSRACSDYFQSGRGGGAGEAKAELSRGIWDALLECADMEEAGNGLARSWIWSAEHVIGEETDGFFAESMAADWESWKRDVSVRCGGRLGFAGERMLGGLDPCFLSVGPVVIGLSGDGEERLVLEKIRAEDILREAGLDYRATAESALGSAEWAVERASCLDSAQYTDRAEYDSGRLMTHPNATWCDIHVDDAHEEMIEANMEYFAGALPHYARPEDIPAGCPIALSCGQVFVRAEAPADHPLVAAWLETAINDECAAPDPDEPKQGGGSAKPRM